MASPNWIFTRFRNGTPYGSNPTFFAACAEVGSFHQCAGIGDNLPSNPGVHADAQVGGAPVTPTR
jgi:hypothetical protein